MQIPADYEWNWQDLESFFEYLKWHGSEFFRADFTRLANGEAEPQGYGHLEAVTYRVRGLHFRDLKALFLDAQSNPSVRIKSVSWASEENASRVTLNLREKTLSIHTGSMSLIELLRHKLSRTPPLQTTVNLLAAYHP